MSNILTSMKHKKQIDIIIECGMSRIEFSNSIHDIFLAKDDIGNNIYFKQLNIEDKIKLLEAIIEDYKESL